VTKSQPRRPPSIDALARSLEVDLPNALRVDAARAAVAAGEPERVEHYARLIERLLLQPVVNATGVLLHTNLGRAPLPVSVGALATNLELDLASGQRGDRCAGINRIMSTLCAAERTIVVNNGAAAVLLSLAALASGAEVAVSRGESVEIGGGFRVPDVAAQSGARLVDVGTTNRTNLNDYLNALRRPQANVACVLKVHPSNFRLEGFVASTPTRELASLPIPVIVDLGSGLVDAACPWLQGGPPGWLIGEPAARQTLADGAALVTFSCDKLLGGPQAGIIAGRADLVDRCARHPLARALRPGSLILETLQSVLLAYLNRDLSSLPFWQMVTVDRPVLEQRAAHIIDDIGQGRSAPVKAVPSEALIGAGSAPGKTLPSIALEVAGDHRRQLRDHYPPVIARVDGGTTLVDLRTVHPDEDAHIVTALGTVREATASEDLGHP